MAHYGMVRSTFYSPSHSSSGGKSAIRKMYESIMPGSAHMQRARMHLTAGGEAIRGGGEGVITGAALGAAHAMLPTGLDMSIPGTSMKGPVDAALAAAALAGSAVLAGEDFSTDLRNVGISSAAVFGFRKTNEFVAAKRLAAHKPAFTQMTAHGEEDPIIRAARAL